MEFIKKCGNCYHLTNKNVKIAVPELQKGKCDMNGKKMLGCYIAGWCPYWVHRDKNYSIGREGE